MLVREKVGSLAREQSLKWGHKHRFITLTMNMAEEMKKERLLFLEKSFQSLRKESANKKLA